MGASPNWTAPTWDDVAGCHANASSGDTITVAPGTYAVTSNTNLSGKYVRVVAAPGTVTLTDNTCAGACGGTDMITIGESPDGSVEFSGFTVNQGTAIHQAPAAVITMYRHSTPIDMGKPIIIKGNTYNPVNNGDFIHASTNKGVIVGNTLDATALIHNSGGNCRAGVVGFVRHKLASAGPDWSSPSTFGAADTAGENHVYIENNTIINDVENPLDSDDYGRTVFRFNKVINGGLATHGADTSGTGVRYAEIYGNTFTYDNTPQPACNIAGSLAPLDVNGFIGLRGGTNLIFNNVIPDISSSWWGNKSEIVLYEEKIQRNAGPYACWSTTTAPGAGYPSPRQVGWGFTKGGTNPGNLGVLQDLEPIYIFNNTGGGNYSSVGAAGYSPNECGTSAPNPADYVKENREFYLHKTSFNGTVGVGAGPRSSRPSTCAAGVAYWSTDQGGNWDTANGATNDGTLDKCTAANVWTNNWYTPYVYPHPLSGPSPLPPQPAMPVITMQPSSQTVVAGQTATFSVTATGSPTPTYQWRRGQMAIAGAIGSMYTTPATVAGDNGAVFDVIATNSSGSVTSAPATLTVTASTGDTIQPTTPSNVTVNPVSTSQLNLAWTASTDNVGVTAYHVYRCQGAGCGTFSQVATPTTATYSDIGLATATSYSYRIRATDAAGNLSSYSPAVFGTTLGGNPCTGTPLTFSVSRWPQSSSGNNRQTTYSVNRPAIITFDVLMNPWKATAVDANNCMVTVIRP